MIEIILLLTVLLIIIYFNRIKNSSFKIFGIFSERLRRDVEKPDVKKIYQIFDLASRNYDEGGLEEALSQYDGLLRLLSQDKVYDKIRFRVYENISEIHLNRNETEKARLFLIKAAEISSSNGNKWYESTFLERAGDISIKSDLFSQAKEDLINAFKAAYQTKDGHQKIGCLIKLLHVLDKLGELGEMRTYGEEGLSISRQIRDQNHEKIILNLLSNTYERLGDREKSLVYRLKAESIMEIHIKTWTIKNSPPITELKRNDYNNRILIEFPKVTSNNILIKIKRLIRKTLRSFRNITFS